MFKTSNHIFYRKNRPAIELDFSKSLQFSKHEFSPKTRIEFGREPQLPVDLHREDHLSNFDPGLLEPS